MEQELGTTLHQRKQVAPWPGSSVDWSVVPIGQEVEGFIPSQGTYKNQPIHAQISCNNKLMFFYLSLPLSLSKINQSKKNLKRKQVDLNNQKKQLKGTEHDCLRGVGIGFSSCQGVKSDSSA